MNDWSPVLIVGFIMFGALFGYMAGLITRIYKTIELQNEIYRVRRDNAVLLATNEKLTRAMVDNYVEPAKDAGEEQPKPVKKKRGQMDVPPPPVVDPKSPMELLNEFPD